MQAVLFPVWDLHNASGMSSIGEEQIHDDRY